MTAPTVTPSANPRALLLRQEIALLDVRHEAVFATGHPLFAANMAADRIAIEAEMDCRARMCRSLSTTLAKALSARRWIALKALGYTDVRELDGGSGWQRAGYELSRTSIPTPRRLANWSSRAGTRLAARGRSRRADREQGRYRGPRCPAVRRIRHHEHPGLRQRARRRIGAARRPRRAGSATTIIVNCAGRTRSIIGTQSLINAGVANKVVALRNGTIGWTLAEQDSSTAPTGAAAIGLFEGAKPMPATSPIAPASGMSARTKRRRCRRRPTARSIASTFATREEYAAGHIAGFRHYPGGQLVQEIDMAAPVRGARILLTDDKGVRADMTASWLAQMGWETYVLDGGYDGVLEAKPPLVLPKPDPSHRYRRPYEGTDVDTGAMQAYLDWEYGLVEQLRRDATHGFFVI